MSDLKKEAIAMSKMKKIPGPQNTYTFPAH